MVFPWLVRYECTDIGYIQGFASEVVIPCSRMLEAWNHAQLSDAKVRYDHGIHVVAIEVEALAIAAYVPIEIAPLEWVGVLHFQLA